MAYLTLSLLMMTQKDFLDSVDQDQTAQNVQFYLWSTLFLHFHSRLYLNCFFILQWKYIFSQWKTKIYLFASERVWDKSQ